MIRSRRWDRSIRSSADTFDLISRILHTIVPLVQTCHETSRALVPTFHSSPKNRQFVGGTNSFTIDRSASAALTTTHIIRILTMPLTRIAIASEAWDGKAVVRRPELLYANEMQKRCRFGWNAPTLLCLGRSLERLPHIISKYQHCRSRGLGEFAQCFRKIVPVLKTLYRPSRRFRHYRQIRR